MVRLKDLWGGKNLEILIMIVSFHLILPKFRMELWPLAFSNLERETRVYGTKQPNKSIWNHTESSVGFCHW